MNPVLAYALQSIGWAGAGFLGGVLVGRTARDVRRIADAVADDNGEDTDDVPLIAQRPRWTDRASSQTLIAIIVVLLGVVTVVQGIVQNNATDRVTGCQVEYSNKFADALDARSQASTDAQDALDELLTAVNNTLQGNPTDSRAAVQRAISEYLAKRAALKAQQQAHPYPPPPRASCP